MVVKKVKTILDGYYSIDLGMLVWLKPSYYGKKYMAALKSLYIETDKNRILVDTGIGDLPSQYKKYYEIDRKTTIEKELRAMSLTPDDISIVVNTHLHFDHCGNNHLFKSATHMVQERELNYALNPPERFMKGGYIREYLDCYNFKTIDGEHHLDDDVLLIQTPGHTPGHQSVIVKKENKKYIFCGDVAPLQENIKRGVIIGISIDPVALERSLDLIRNMDGVKISSHDSEDMVVEGV